MHSKENKGDNILEGEVGKVQAYYDHLLIFTIMIHMQLLNKIIYFLILPFVVQYSVYFLKTFLWELFDSLL